MGGLGNMSVGTLRSQKTASDAWEHPAERQEAVRTLNCWALSLAPNWILNKANTILLNFAFEPSNFSHEICKWATHSHVHLILENTYWFTLLWKKDYGETCSSMNYDY